MSTKMGSATLQIETSKGKYEKFECQFNPADYTINARGTITKLDTLNTKTSKQQTGAESTRTLSLTLYFDTSASKVLLPDGSVQQNKAKDVSTYTNKLLSIVHVSGDLHRMPKVIFTWGPLSFSGKAESVNVHYTMFEQSGMPVRAEVNLSIQREYDSTEVKKDPPSSPDRTKCIVLTGDRDIWSIAEAEYGSASYWREIANANGIRNPLNIPIGTYLKVPALHL